MQTVLNEWSDGLLFDELLAQHGFAVLHADNRGMAGRGREFAQAAYHNFGPVQFEDQFTVVDAVLAKYPQLVSTPSRAACFIKARPSSKPPPATPAWAWP